MKMAKLKSSTLGLMKKRPTRLSKTLQKKASKKVLLSLEGKLYELPEKLFGKLEKELEPHLVKRISSHQGITFESFFKDDHKKLPEWAINLKGLRYRENLTQIEFAKKLGLSQSNLSAIENGKRAIGKLLATRIERKFKINYRHFL